MAIEVLYILVLVVSISYDMGALTVPYGNAAKQVMHFVYGLLRIVTCFRRCTDISYPKYQGFLAVPFLRARRTRVRLGTGDERSSPTRSPCDRRVISCARIRA